MPLTSRWFAAKKAAAAAAAPKNQPASPGVARQAERPRPVRRADRRGGGERDAPAVGEDDVAAVGAVVDRGEQAAQRRGHHGRAHQHRRQDRQVVQADRAALARLHHPRMQAQEPGQHDGDQRGIDVRDLDEGQREDDRERPRAPGPPRSGGIPGASPPLRRRYRRIAQNRYAITGQKLPPSGGFVRAGPPDPGGPQRVRQRAVALPAVDRAAERGEEGGEAGGGGEDAGLHGGFLRRVGCSAGPGMRDGRPVRSDPSRRNDGVQRDLRPSIESNWGESENQRTVAVRYPRSGDLAVRQRGGGGRDARRGSRARRGARPPARRPRGPGRSRPCRRRCRTAARRGRRRRAARPRARRARGRGPGRPATGRCAATPPARACAAGGSSSPAGGGGGSSSKRA